MQLATTLLALLGTASAFEVTSTVANNSRVAVPATDRKPKGAADIDLDDLLSERITKRKAMTYCADQDSTDGMLISFHIYSAEPPLTRRLRQLQSS